MSEIAEEQAGGSLLASMANPGLSPSHGGNARRGGLSGSSGMGLSEKLIALILADGAIDSRLHGSHKRIPECGHGHPLDSTHTEQMTRREPPTGGYHPIEQDSVTPTEWWTDYAPSRGKTWTR